MQFKVMSCVHGMHRPSVTLLHAVRQNLMRDESLRCTLPSTLPYTARIACENLGAAFRLRLGKIVIRQDERAKVRCAPCCADGKSQENHAK